MMKPIELIDLMNIYEYEKVRDQYRKDIIKYKKNRRIALGPDITLTFDNRKTLIFQILEIMRAERLVHNDQIQNEIDVYNSILPGENNLRATLFLEVQETDQIQPVLNRFIGITTGRNIYLVINGKKIFAEFEIGREETNKISSVHYIQFQFNEDLKSIMVDQDSEVELAIDYKGYVFNQKLSVEQKLSLVEDLMFD